MGLCIFRIRGAKWNSIKGMILNQTLKSSGLSWWSRYRLFSGISVIPSEAFSYHGLQDKIVAPVLIA